jgi:hypothetical protein
MTATPTRVIRATRHLAASLARVTAFLTLATGMPAAADAAAGGPTIQLFPTTVLEDIKQTGAVAEEMESGLQDVIARMDRQQALYTDSKCEGADGDPGCHQIARQLGATYLEMLDTMAARLPEMEQAVNSTRTSLQRRLQREVGRNMTAWDLQKMLLGSGAAETARERPALRGRSGMRLSDRFSRYYQLVAHAGTTNSSSLAVIAADIYLDMDEAATLIARTRDEINRAALMEQLNQSFGQVTPEMAAVVDGVKAILFGESAPYPAVADAPIAAERRPYRSPLSM